MKKYVGKYNPWNKGLTKDTDSRIIGTKHTEEWKKEASERMLGNKNSLNHLNSEEHRKETSKRMLVNHPMKRLEIRLKMLGNKNPLGCVRSAETLAKISGANSCNWLGGSSFDPYSFEFTKRLKNKIKERDGNECKNPFCLKVCKILTIHHIDYNKQNCDPNNLITLCNSCNGKANYNRECWKKIYDEVIEKRFTYKRR